MEAIAQKAEESEGRAPYPPSCTIETMALRIGTGLHTSLTSSRCLTLESKDENRGPGNGVAELLTGWDRLIHGTTAPAHHC